MRYTDQIEKHAFHPAKVTLTPTENKREIPNCKGFSLFCSLSIRCCKQCQKHQTARNFKKFQHLPKLERFQLWALWLLKSTRPLPTRPSPFVTLTFLFRNCFGVAIYLYPGESESAGGSSACGASAAALLDHCRPLSPLRPIRFCCCQRQRQKKQNCHTCTEYRNLQIAFACQRSKYFTRQTLKRHHTHTRRICLYRVQFILFANLP